MRIVAREWAGQFSAQNLRFASANHGYFALNESLGREHVTAKRKGKTAHELMFVGRCRWSDTGSKARDRFHKNKFR